jgi:hypothetical protein
MVVSYKTGVVYEGEFAIAVPPTGAVNQKIESAEAAFMVVEVL